MKADPAAPSSLILQPSSFAPHPSSLILQTFFQKFNQFADAPDAVAKMRELVLQLAVTGRLFGKAVETEANGVPNGWHERQLGDVARFINGDRSKNYPSKSFRVDDGVPFINAGHLSNGDVDLTDMDYITPEHFDRLGGGKVEPGDVLYCLRGSLGKCAIVQSIKCGAIASSLIIIRPSQQIASRFIYLFLTSPLGARMIAKYDNGSAQPNLSAANVKKYIVPLPPLAEQKRIVAKVDELMALCDRLEAQQQERETRHTALARASLARFADAPTPANIPFLFHPSYAIPPADLRKSILDLAVYGKLAAPAPEDDEIPSIEEFREAAASIANSLGLRSPKESLYETDPLFDVPDHWRWMALADLGAAQTGTTPSKNDHGAFNGDIPFIKPADILPDGINYSNESLTRYGAESGSRLAPAGSLLMVCIGTIGKCNLIERECAFNQQINSLSPVQWIDSQYLLLAVRAPYFQDAAWKKSSSTTIAILNKGKWLSIPVPIPPLAEQHRIVAKVEQLMALVDALETQLAASRATAANLLEALVAELTAA